MSKINYLLQNIIPFTTMIKKGMLKGEGNNLGGHYGYELWALQ